jgi:hypothetical protein
MNDRNLSELSLERKECPKCGAVWINGQHMWRTGAKGSELDLAGLAITTAIQRASIHLKVRKVETPGLTVL